MLRKNHDWKWDQDNVVRYFQPKWSESMTNFLQQNKLMTGLDYTISRHRLKNKTGKGRAYLIHYSITFVDPKQALLFKLSVL
jgi:hypothetical protein